MAKDGNLKNRISDDSETIQMSLHERFMQSRIHTETICENLALEDYSVQPATFVSPPKWHLAHTSWFYEELLLKPFLRGYKPYDENFSYIFNSYYNNLGERIERGNRGDVSRPTVKEVMSYRNYITEHVARLLKTTSDVEMLGILETGINHEEQHAELLIYDIKYILGNQPLSPGYPTAIDTRIEKQHAEFIEIEEGLYTIGHDSEDFCFDNEQARHKVYLSSFNISDKLVTNGEYLDFINDGGYKNFNLWHSDGWDHIRKNNIQAPLYWRENESGWQEYRLSGMEDLNLEAPVMHISYYEAFAFAEWKGMRLPTEFEWEAAAPRLKWGQLWEWTGSAYLPYPGFKKAQGALGEYNYKFMVNQHVLRGASVATPARHRRKTYRNFFHPDMRWMFSGIRLVK